MLVNKNSRCLLLFADLKTICFKLFRSSGQIKQTLSFNISSGNEITDPSTVDGYYFNSKNVVDLFSKTASSQMKISENEFQVIVQSQNTILSSNNIDLIFITHIMS
jgi:hypothetical protein